MSNLLDCPLKLTTSTDLAQGLLNYIQSYHEDHVAHPEALKPDLELIKSCRTPIEDKLTVNQSSLNSLIRYHAHLAYILPKFPDDVGVEFSYSAIFSTSTTAGSILPGELPSCLPIKLSNLKYERACVLFNIAAITMSLGTSVPRTNTDQLKRAIGFFQKSNGTISRIAQETSRLYDLTLNLMKDVQKLDIHWIGFAFPDDWISFAHLKSAHFLAVAQFRKGLDDSAAREYGIEVGRLEYACSTLKTAISAAKSCSTETTKTVLQEAKNVFVKLQKSLELARRDNDLIYLKQVPSDAELPVIKPVSLVKPSLPQPVSDPSEFLTEDQFGRRLFEQVVPYQVYRIIGVYEDRKKDHLKSAIQDQADSLDAEMVDALRSMNLPGSLEALERPINLPPSLLRSSEELRQQNAPQMLISMLSSVEQASQVNWDALAQIATMLAEEKSEDQQYRTRFGTQLWQRPSSQIANRPLREQESQLLQTFEPAEQSDRSVKERYDNWRKAIELLCQDEDTIRKAIPPLNMTDRRPQDLSLPPTGQSELSSPRQLRRLLDDLEDLRGSRKRLVGSALHFASHDSIDRALIESFDRTLHRKSLSSNNAPSSSTIEIADDEQIELFIEKELEKYSKFSGQLDANRLAQNDLIQQIRSVNQEFLRSRTDDPVTKARENVFQELDSAYHEFHSIINNLQEGLQFHSQFNKYANILKNEVDSYLHDRRRQAVALEQQLNNLQLNAVSKPAPSRDDSRSQKANGKKKMDDADGDVVMEDPQPPLDRVPVASPSSSSAVGQRPSNSRRKKQAAPPGAYDR
ncbi:pH-response regulator protein palA/rim20 [Puccinia graminis f. sp. tritici]|uniref:pH-response regulator protein palA/rim20 n=1 Tax=Puccinia graminis f. sp. tritici TaxID=56615 RepID=A0A5B0MLR4_PUCGR|nr:pH-response regulator protein palA/rim20 [Puccinia graminis f. sp. tritici]